MDQVAVNNEKKAMDAQEEAQLEAIIQNLDMNDQDAETLRSLTRLLVGGALVGWDELLAHLKAWEAEAEARRSDRVLPSAATSPVTSKAPAAILRYAMIGLLFESQDRWARRSESALKLVGRTTDALFSPLVRNLERDRRWLPARRRFQNLVARGESIARQWVERGRLEEAQSRMLARTAAQEGFNTSMDLLGQAPALQDLVRKQSAGLTQDVVDEVRARTVTADILTEHLARSVLRRKPRRELPAPPTANPQDQVPTKAG